VLRDGFTKDAQRQKNGWCLVFLKHGQIASELVPYLVSRGHARHLTPSYGYGKYFPKVGDQLDHSAIYQLFLSNSAAFEYRSERGPVKLMRIVQDLVQLPPDVKQEIQAAIALAEAQA
jgi:hypothetical protein